MVVLEPISTPPVQESTKEKSSTATTGEESLHGPGNAVESATAVTSGSSGNDSDEYETASETETNDADREPENNNNIVSNHDNGDGLVRRDVKEEEEEERKEENESGRNELNEVLLLPYVFLTGLLSVVLSYRVYRN